MFIGEHFCRAPQAAAAVGRNERYQDADEGRFSGAVGADEDRKASLSCASNDTLSESNHVIEFFADDPSPGLQP
jgi:hypothetical protein